MSVIFRRPRSASSAATNGIPKTHDHVSNNFRRWDRHSRSANRIINMFSRTFSCCLLQFCTTPRRLFQLLGLFVCRSRSVFTAPSHSSIFLGMHQLPVMTNPSAREPVLRHQLLHDAGLHFGCGPWVRQQSPCHHRSRKGCPRPHIR